MEKKRLDLLLVEKNMVQSRERARAMIMAGRILVNDVPVDKAGTKVSIDADIVLKGEDIPFVSRGGLKLDHAVKGLGIDVTGLTCLDIGASTGGFTDCLLQHGAGKVYAVDVGYGQLAWSLRQDPRVVVIERTNIRHLEYDVVGESVDLVVADTSFISLKLVIPAAEKFMKKGTRILALIKPQFEAGRERIGKGGVVRDPKVRQEIIGEIKEFFDNRGYETGEVIPSPVPGPKGNQEFIISLRYLDNICNKT
ncbi:MAG: TlyA family RNA methyltransferase [Desulfobacteraceae bacterium]|nr:TlyA family RNA methyltransferase [Desulfobacteraceae bacterium]